MCGSEFWTKNFGSSFQDAPELPNELSDGNTLEMNASLQANPLTVESQPNGNPGDENPRVRLLQRNSNASGFAVEQIASVVTKKLRRDRELQKRRSEWKVIATVLDRFFFATWLLLLVISFACLFPRPESIPQSN